MSVWAAKQKLTHCVKQRRAPSQVLTELYFLAGPYRSPVNGHCHMKMCVFIWLLRQHWDLARCLLQVSKELASLKPLGDFSIADFIFFANSDISKYHSPMRGCILAIMTYLRDAWLRKESCGIYIHILQSLQGWLYIYKWINAIIETNSVYYTDLIPKIVNAIFKWVLAYEAIKNVLL